MTDPPSRHRLYEQLEHPDLTSPVLLVALKGWVDAGLGAEGAVEVLADQLQLRTVARFDPDVLLDWRARRPMMRLSDGILADLTWDTTELSWTRDQAGNDVLLLAGDEPDQGWLAFTDAVADLARSLGVRMLVGLGAYPTPAPHTRAPLLACSASSEELASQGFVRANVEVPSGVQGMLERELARRGVPAIGLWVQVPHYVAAMPYPAASLTLLEGANRIAGLSLPTGELAERSDRARSRIDELISQNPEHLAMLRQLEEQADEMSTAVQMQATSGDEIAAELERFLRDQG
jgi:predicted ATP-grasp superfamily ATP-dependent carboligase